MSEQFPCQNNFGGARLKQMVEGPLGTPRTPRPSEGNGSSSSDDDDDINRASFLLCDKFVASSGDDNKLNTGAVEDLLQGLIHISYSTLRMMTALYDARKKASIYSYSLLAHT